MESILPCNFVFGLVYLEGVSSRIVLPAFLHWSCLDNCSPSFEGSLTMSIGASKEEEADAQFHMSYPQISASELIILRQSETPVDGPSGL